MLLQFLFLNGLYSQALEANHWYFGYGSGLRFYPNGPKPELNGIQRATDGVASISNAKGKLLFYTDRRNIYNSQHDTMKYATNIFDSRANLIVKIPSSSTLYYLFTIEGLSNQFDAQCSIHLIDMSRENGLGSVVSQNNFPDRIERAGLSVFDHLNGIDKWIVFKSYDSESFISYLITSIGIDYSSKVVSSFGQKDTTALSRIKASPNSNFLSICYYHPRNNFELYKFNKASGQVESKVFASKENASIPNSVVSSAFASNSQILFVSFLNKLLAYDIRSKDSSLIDRSRLILDSNQRSFETFRDLQLGLDGNLYFINAEHNHQISRKLSRIKCPDNIFDTVIIEDTIIGPLGIVLGSFLPTLNQTLYVNTHKLQAQSTGDTLLCVGDSSQLTAYGAGANQFAWSPAHGLSCTNCPSPKAAPDSSITYRVIGTATSCSQDNIDTAYVRIDVVPPKGSASIIGDSILCPGERITLRSPSGFTSFRWLHNNFTSPATFVDTPGTYLLALSGKCYNDTLVQKVSLETPLSYSFPNDTTICARDFPISLTASANFPILINDSLRSNELINEPGNYTFRSANKCQSASKTVVVDTLVLDAIQDPSSLPDSLFVGDNLVLPFNTWLSNMSFQQGETYIVDSSNTSIDVFQLRSLESCSDTLFVKQINITKKDTASDSVATECLIDVSPNPGNGLINIKSSIELEKLSVYDMSGKTVFNLEAEGQKSLRIELPDLSAGNYLIQAQCVNQKRHEVKWMRR